jgi:hypothetical protein
MTMNWFLIFVLGLFCSVAQSQSTESSPRKSNITLSTKAIKELREKWLDLSQKSSQFNNKSTRKPLENSRILFQTVMKKSKKLQEIVNSAKIPVSSTPVQVQDERMFNLILTIQKT